MTDDESSNEPLDILWGAAAIARFINRTQRQTHHLLHRGRSTLQRKSEAAGARTEMPCGTNLKPPLVSAPGVPRDARQQVACRMPGL
jgi:hypothetical protein